MSSELDNYEPEIASTGLEVLREMAQGAKCYYFYLDGGLRLWPQDGWETGKWIEKPELTFEVFSGLRSRELIEKEGEVGQGDLRFATNTKVDIYGISHVGEKLVETNPQS